MRETPPFNPQPVDQQGDLTTENSQDSFQDDQIHLDLTKKAEWSQKESKEFLKNESNSEKLSSEDYEEKVVAQKIALLDELLERGASAENNRELLAHIKGFKSFSSAMDEFGISEHGTLVCGHNVKFEEQKVGTIQKILGKGLGGRVAKNLKRGGIGGAISLAAMGGLSVLGIISAPLSLPAIAVAASATGAGVFASTVVRGIADKVLRENKIFKNKEDGEHEGSTAHGSAEELIIFLEEVHEYVEGSLQEFLREQGVAEESDQAKEFKLTLYDQVLAAAKTGQPLTQDIEGGVKNYFETLSKYKKDSKIASIGEGILGMAAGIGAGVAGAHAASSMLHDILLNQVAFDQGFKNGISIDNDGQNGTHAVKFFNDHFFFQLTPSDVTGGELHGIVDPNSASPDQIGEFMKYLIKHDPVVGKAYSGGISMEDIWKNISNTLEPESYKTTFTVTEELLAKANDFGVNIYHVKPFVPHMVTDALSSVLSNGIITATTASLFTSADQVVESFKSMVPDWASSKFARENVNVENESTSEKNEATVIQNEEDGMNANEVQVASDFLVRAEEEFDLLYEQMQDTSLSYEQLIEIGDRIEVLSRRIDLIDENESLKDQIDLHLLNTAKSDLERAKQDWIYANSNMVHSGEYDNEVDVPVSEGNFDTSDSKSADQDQKTDSAEGKVRERIANGEYSDFANEFNENRAKITQLLLQDFSQENYNRILQEFAELQLLVQIAEEKYRNNGVPGGTDIIFDKNIKENLENLKNKIDQFENNSLDSSELHNKKNDSDQESIVTEFAENVDSENPVSDFEKFSQFESAISESLENIRKQLEKPYTVQLNEEVTQKLDEALEYIELQRGNYTEQYSRDLFSEYSTKFIEEIERLGAVLQNMVNTSSAEEQENNKTSEEDGGVSMKELNARINSFNLIAGLSKSQQRIMGDAIQKWSPNDMGVVAHLHGKPDNLEYLSEVCRAVIVGNQKGRQSYPVSVIITMSESDLKKVTNISDGASALKQVNAVLSAITKESKNNISVISTPKSSVTNKDWLDTIGDMNNLRKHWGAPLHLVQQKEL